MRQSTILAVLCFLSWTGLTAYGQTDRLAIAGRTGTLGLGGDVIVNVLTDVNLRLGVGWFDLDFDGEVQDIDYEFDLDLLTFPLLVDWYPFENKFHVSAGIVLNQTEASLDAMYNGTLDIGDETYSAEEIGVLSGDLSFRDVAPYIGIGWGNAFGKARRWGFMTDLGVAFTGSPNIALSATGTLAGDPDFQADLAREERDLQDDLDDFKIYPVLSANLYFRF